MCFPDANSRLKPDYDLIAQNAYWDVNLVTGSFEISRGQAATTQAGVLSC